MQIFQQEEQDWEDIQRGMAEILVEIQTSQFEWLLDLEDVHLNIEKRLIEKIGEEEISTTLKFAVIALIILPLLPEHKYSLHDMFVFLPENSFTSAHFFNPYSIWFFVVIMSAVSYVGYILTKALGAGKGIILSGALGGLVSSTAVTSAMAEIIGLFGEGSLI